MFHTTHRPGWHGESWLTKSEKIGKKHFFKSTANKLSSQTRRVFDFILKKNICSTASGLEERAITSAALTASQYRCLRWLIMLLASWRRILRALSKLESLESTLKWNESLDYVNAMWKVIVGQPLFSLFVRGFPAKKVSHTSTDSFSSSHCPVSKEREPRKMRKSNKFP